MGSTFATEHRLFLGIPPGPEMHHSLAAFAAEHAGLPGIRWTAPHNLHITAAFLGNVATAVLPNLCALIQVALRDIPPFELPFSRFRLAPKTRDPRMIWAQFEKEETWLRAVGQIDALLAQIQPQRTSRDSPIPHITLARLKRFQDADRLNFAFPLSPDHLRVRQMVLWESTLRPTGPHYAVVERFPLRANFREKTG